MDNKELPQEIVEDLKEHYSAGIVPHQAYKGAQIAHSHYLKELQAKDTTIKELDEKIEKLTGLLGSMYSLWFKMTYPIHTLNEGIKAWNKYKEQHGI